MGCLCGMFVRYVLTQSSPCVPDWSATWVAGGRTGHGRNPTCIFPLLWSILQEGCVGRNSSGSMVVCCRRRRAHRWRKDQVFPTEIDTRERLEPINTPETNEMCVKSLLGKEQQTPALSTYEGRGLVNVVAFSDRGHSPSPGVGVGPPGTRACGCRYARLECVGSTHLCRRPTHVTHNSRPPEGRCPPLITCCPSTRLHSQIQP